MESKIFALTNIGVSDQFTQINTIDFNAKSLKEKLKKYRDENDSDISEVDLINQFYNLPIKHIPLTGKTICGHILSDNAEAIKQIQETFYSSPTIFYDGVCANGKTTMMEHLKNRSYGTYKHTDLTTFQHMNTCSLDALGYIMSFYETIENFQIPTICDRSPCNNLDWSILWAAFVKYNDEILNSNGKTTIHDILNFIKTYYESIHPKTREFLNSYPTVIVVDSDFEANINRLRERGIKNNIATDINRSYWEFYIPMQYYLYSLKRGENKVVFINLANYKDYSFSEIFDAIEKVFITLFGYVQSNVNYNKRFEQVEFKRPLLLKSDTFDNNLIFNHIKDQGKLIAGKIEDD